MEAIDALLRDKPATEKQMALTEKQMALVKKLNVRSYMEPIVIYKLDSMKFTTQNDLY